MYSIFYVARSFYSLDYYSIKFWIRLSNKSGKVFGIFHHFHSTSAYTSAKPLGENRQDVRFIIIICTYIFFKHSESLNYPFKMLTAIPNNYYEKLIYYKIATLAPRSAKPNDEGFCAENL